MNIRSLLTVLSVALVCLTSCQRSSLRIQGSLSYAPEGDIYLSVLDSSLKWINVDTAHVKEGNFTFDKPFVLEDAECFLLTLGNQHMIVFASNSDDVSMSGNLLQPETIVVTGSKLNDKLVDFMKNVPGHVRLTQLQTLVGTIGNDVDRKEDLLAEIRGIEKEQLGYIRFCVAENVSNPLGPFILLNNLSFFSYDEVNSYLSDFKQTLPNHKYVKMLDATLAALYEKNEALKRLQVGLEAPDFVLPNEQGDTLRLSSLRGSLVILNFWMSSEPKCRKDNESLRDAYAKLNSKGVEMVCVGVNSNFDDWVQAKRDDRMPGYQLIDKDGSVAHLYCIAEVPSCFIIDENGIIVSKDEYSKGLFDDVNSRIKGK